MAENMEEEEVADYQEDDGFYQYTEGEQEENEIDPEEMKKRVLEMEQELENLTSMQQQVEKQITSASDRMDENSIYVGQVDYDATLEELRVHFGPCGTINRITIMCNKLTGQSKGFAYIEFLDKASVDNALKLDDSLFKGRQLKVLPKRQNVPTIIRGGGGRFGGRGGRGGALGPIFVGRGRGRGFPGAAAYIPRGGGAFGFRGGGRFAGRGTYPYPGGGRSRGGGRGFNTYY